MSILPWPGRPRCRASDRLVRSLVHRTRPVVRALSGWPWHGCTSTTHVVQLRSSHARTSSWPARTRCHVSGHIFPRPESMCPILSLLRPVLSLSHPFITLHASGTRERIRFPYCFAVGREMRSTSINSQQSAWPFARSLILACSFLRSHDQFCFRGRLRLV